MTDGNQSGIVGERDMDGWVQWTTCDMGNSYLPSISCGSFELVLGKGKDWGAPSDDQGCLMLAIYGATDEDDMPCNEDEVSFPWCHDAFMEAVCDLLESADDADHVHPSPSNVRAAAHELWIALMFKDAQRAA
jgi:hypothetical protein